MDPAGGDLLAGSEGDTSRLERKRKEGDGGKGGGGGEKMEVGMKRGCGSVSSAQSVTLSS